MPSGSRSPYSPWPWSASNQSDFGGPITGSGFCSFRPCSSVHVGWETERVIRLMLWGIVALTVVAPYWWFSTGWAGDALEAVLPVWTFATLLVWGVAEYMGWKRSLHPIRLDH